MRTTILLLLSAALAADEPPAPPAPEAGKAAAEEPVPPLAGSTGELLAALEGKLATEAAAALGKVVAGYPKGTEEEQKEAIAAVGKAAGDKDLRVRHAAIAALGALRAKGSSRHLQRWLAPPKSLKDEMPTTYVEAARAAGAIADPATLDTLLKLSDHQVLEIAVAATEAIGGYHALPVGRRKTIAFDLVDRLRMLTTPSRRAAYDMEATARRAGLSAATITALQRLTGLRFESPKGWTDWKDGAKNRANPFE